MELSELSNVATEKMGQAISLQVILEIDETTQPRSQIYLQDSEKSTELRVQVIGNINEIL